jgi:hypothetical protein
MILLASYLLKVMVCSAILFLYYHLALRNKLFHQWNRFYLLAAIVLSLLIPVIEIQIKAMSEDNAPILSAVRSANVYLDNVVVSKQHSISMETWMSIGYATVSIVLLFLLVISIIRLYKIIRSHSISIVEDIRFINTNVDGTPFSFFRFIFWNYDIPLQSEEGQHIFQHELVHVKENHSFDKLFVQLVLVFFWCNPFFWLMRREIKAIHEFIADKKAVGQYGVQAFAAMILQAGYKQSYHSLTSQFFQTSIKRRLTMLTKIQNAKLNYISRIIALPVVVVLIMAFGVKENNVTNDKETVSNVLIENVRLDTVPDLFYKGKKLKNLDVNPSQQKAFITYPNGKKDTVPLNSVELHLVPPPPPPVSLSNNVLKIVDGKEFKEDINLINPQSIESINIVKGQTAISKYGEKGKDGVIEIQLKKVVKDTIPNNQPVFDKAEVSASIDIKLWRQFLEKNLQPLIEQAAAGGAKTGQYTTELRFIVEKDGSLSHIEVVKDPGFGVGEKLKSLLADSPRWNPAVQNGKTVRSYHLQPVTLVISDGAVVSPSSTYTDKTIKSNTVGVQSVSNKTPASDPLRPVVVQGRKITD